MVMSPLPSLDDLIWLFEGDPLPLHPDRIVPGGGAIDWRRDWPYTTVTFCLARADAVVSVTLNPGYEDVRVSVVRDGVETDDLALKRVRTMAVEKIHGRELLRLEFHDHAVFGPLLLRLKPDVSIGWAVGRD